MTSYQQNQLTSLPVTPFHAPLVITPLRHKTPSLPVLRHSPSLQTLNFHPLGFQPLNAFRAKLHSQKGTAPIIEDADPMPRPLRIKKVRKSPSMPFGGAWEPKSSQISRRGPPPPKNFLGLGFPPQPKPRSSSAGVLLADKGGNTPPNMSTDPRSSAIRRASSQRDGQKKEMPGSGMAWLQRPKSDRPLSTIPLTSENQGLDDIESGVAFSPPPRYLGTRRLSMKTPTSRNSSGDATAGTSRRSSSYQSTMKTSDHPETEEMDLIGGARKTVSDLRRFSSTRGGSGYGKKHKLDFMNPSTLSKDTETATEKTPAKGWKEKMFSKDFFTRGGGSVTPKKEGKPKQRERTNSVSTAPILKTPHIPRPFTAIGNSVYTRIDIPSSNGWRENDYRQNRTEEWQLDGHAIASSLTDTGIRSRNALNDSVLGIYEGSVGDIGRTKLKKVGQWKPPGLQLQMEVVAETEKVPISHPGDPGGDKIVWVSIELDGKVDKGTESFEGSKVGLDVGVLMDISAYTSNISLTSMKLQAKRLVEAMETSRDRVAVMTFPVPPTSSGTSREGVHVLNSSGSVAKQQLMDDISLLSQSKLSLDPAGRNVRTAVLASIKKLKGMPLNTVRYGSHRHGHLFVLTSKLDIGEIELLPEVFFGEIQIHIIGIGALFWPRNEMGASGWCFPTRTLGHRPSMGKSKKEKSEDDFSPEKEGIEIEDIIPLLRKAVDLGVLRDLNIELQAGENCSVRAVMGELKYNKILPGEKRTLLIQVQVEDMPIPDNDEYDLDGNREGMPRWVILERQLEATLGELKGRLLSVKASYRHSNFSGTTIFSTERNLEITRFAEDSLWRFSPSGNRFINKEKSPPVTPIIAEDYVKNVLIQRVASMHSSPSLALRAVREIANSSLSKYPSFNEISRELLYRDKVEKKFKTRAGYADGPQEEMLIDFADYSTSLPSDTRISMEDFLSPPQHTVISDVDPVDKDCRYRGSRELRNEDRAPFIAAVDSSPDTERPNIDPDDEAQRIWQEIKLRQRGVSSGSIKRRSVRSKLVASFYGREQLDDRLGDPDDGDDALSTVYSSVLISNEDSEAEGGGDLRRMSRSGQETVHSLVTLRGVRETDFGPWAM